MTTPTQTSIYVARLSAAEKEAIFEQDKAFPNSNLKSALLDAVADVCVDRLIRADGCFQVAKQLCSSSDGETLRAGVARAYYSMHHSLRAMALWRNKWDPDGHEESIKQLKLLLEDNSFVGKSGLAADDWEKVTEARNNRHVADYSPYDSQREPRGMVRITGNDWRSAAQFNYDLAEKLLNSAIKVVGS